VITSTQYDRIARVLPLLRGADQAAQREFQQAAYYARIPAGKDISVVGDHPDVLGLVIAGVVRVYMIGQTGREITLYRFGSGESCILTANAILSRQEFPALATVEQDVEAAMIPEAVFRDWVRRHDLWREFVFDLLSQRLLDVLSIVDEVVFRRMDARVAALLLNRCRAENPLSITHQEIAAELGSSREVISRILEGFTSAGMIRSGRGEIEVVDRVSLGSLSAA
jgi:CRP/FNR family transcriptional regulator